MLKNFTALHNASEMEKSAEKQVFYVDAEIVKYALHVAFKICHRNEDEYAYQDLVTRANFCSILE